MLPCENTCSGSMSSSLAPQQPHVSWPQRFNFLWEMEETHPSLIFMPDFYFGAARPPPGSAQRARPRLGGSVGVHGSAGHSCPQRGMAALPHAGHENPPGNVPLSFRAGLGHNVPFLFSRSKIESSIVSQFENIIPSTQISP